MRKFEYRSARFATDVSLTYTDESVQTSGVCTQVSLDGMEAHLLDSPTVGNSGSISMVFEGRTVEIEVRVARVQQDRCGIEFVYKSERERRMMDEFITRARRGSRTP